MIGVAFGLQGTLVARGDSELRAFRSVAVEHAARLGVALSETRVASAADALFRSDASRRPGFPRAVARVLNSLLGECESDPALEAGFRRLAAALSRESIRPFSDTRGTLEQIASLGIPRAILTNAIGSVARSEAASIGFDGPVLVAEDIDAWKPDRRAFDRLAAALGLPPDRIWFVGADPERDVRAAREAGLQTIWLSRDGVADETHADVAGNVVPAMSEILPILAEQYTRSLLGLRYVIHCALSWRAGHFVPGVEYRSISDAL